MTEPGRADRAGGPWNGRRLHFVGVGGAGMSGYARVAHALGAEVSGSDAAAGAYLEGLSADGVLHASIGHDAHNVPAGDGVELIYSSAVPAGNVERAAARERGIPERPRAELLAELTGLRRTIAVAGTHGKTTTASMLVHALRGAGLDPGWLVGGSVGAGLANAEWGSGEWLVVEADESDRSMLSLDVEIAVLTNVELRSPRDVRLARGAAGGVSPLPRRPSARGRSGIGPSCWSCAPGPSIPMTPRR